MGRWPRRRFARATPRRSVLLARAPERRAPSDDAALELGAAARAVPAATALGDELGHARVATAQRHADDRAHVAPEAVELVLAELGGGAAGIEQRAPEDLVGHEVPDARHDRLVHEPRLHRRVADRHQLAEAPAID